MIGYIVVGLCTAPLNTVLFYTVELDVDPARRTEAFSSVTTANAIGFAVPGTLLALMSLSATFALSGGFAAVALVVTLAYGHHRTTTPAGPANPAAAEQPAAAIPGQAEANAAEQPAADETIRST